MSEGVHTLHFTCRADFFARMECVDVADADIDVSLRIECRHDAFAMSFHTSGWVDTPCDRCLEPVRIDICEDYPLTVRYGADYDDSTDGVLVIPDSEPDLDVAPIIRDNVLLALPIRRVHPDGECDPEASRVLCDHSASEGDGGEDGD